MNKRYKIIAIAVALATASACAIADDPGAFFINGNIGQSDYHDNGFNDRTDTSFAVRGGYTWFGGPVDFGVETGYVDLGRAKGSVNTGLGSTNYNVKQDGPLLGANLKYKFGNGVFLSARGGWFHSTVDLDIPGVASEHFHGDGDYLGLGLGYDINRHFSVGVGYDNYHGRESVAGQKVNTGVGVVSGFAEYRF